MLTLAAMTNVTPAHVLPSPVVHFNWSTGEVSTDNNSTSALKVKGQHANYAEELYFFYSLTHKKSNMTKHEIQ